MLPLTTKSSSLYIACRVYAVLGILAFWAGCVYGIYEMLSRNQFSIFMLVAVFLGVPAILMVLNWAAFPFHYSAFGLYLRHPYPSEQPLQIVRHSWATVGSLNSSVPMVTWSCFPHGVGIDVWLIGRVYLRADCITMVEKDWLGRYKIQHTAADVRSPITMPKSVFLALYSAWDESRFGSLLMP